MFRLTHDLVQAIRDMTAEPQRPARRIGFSEWKDGEAGVRPKGAAPKAR